MKFRNFCRQALLLRRLLCSLCLTAGCFAQQNKLVVAPPDPVSIKRGGTAEAHLKLATIPGFHVNSDAPSEAYIIPLKLTWDAGILEAKSIHYPQPETIELGTDKLSVFTGSFEIVTTVAAPRNAAPGPGSLTGRLRYQACNNRMCFRPATIEVRVPVSVE